MNYEQQLRLYVQLSKEVKDQRFSSWIYDKLQESGKTQTQIGNEINCTPQAIHTYCAGKSFPSIKTLEKLLDVFDLALSKIERKN